MRRRALHLVICCLAWFPRTILPQTPAPPASPNPILVELFTSEGCSDCPPADELLRRNNSKSLRNTLLAEIPGPHVDLRILSVERSPDALTVHFSAANVATGTPLDILAAITDDIDETHVERGENGGRTLTHVSVARSFGRLAEVRGDSEQTTRIPWPAALKASPEAARHLLLFAQQRNYGKVVGATSKPLPKSGAATEADEKTQRAE